MDMSNDSHYVDRDLDTKEPRQFLVCTACPLIEQCSVNSWKRANCRSQDTDELVRKVRDHLMVSGLHNCTDEEADNLVCSIDIVVEKETYAVREAQRVQLERIAEDKEQKGKGKNKGGGKGKEKGKENVKTYL